MHSNKFYKRGIFIGFITCMLFIPGCGSTFGLFNPAFVNTTSGGEFPVTPGPGAAFVFVRGFNETTQVVEFIITIEREVSVSDEAGIPLLDALGNFITQPERETVQLTTFPQGLANDLGVLFPCNISAVTLVGLGENLLPTDPVIFVGGQGPAGTGGFGVTAPNLNPLSLLAGNFNCGDTIIFRAFTNFGVAGGVSVQTFLLPGSEQPSIFDGPDTFVNFQLFLSSQSSQSGP